MRNERLPVAPLLNEVDGADVAPDLAARVVKDVNYLPLPARAYADNLERIAARKLGTVYGGEAKSRPRPGDSFQLLKALLHGS